MPFIVVFVIYDAVSVDVVTVDVITVDVVSVGAVTVDVVTVDVVTVYVVSVVLYVNMVVQFLFRIWIIRLIWVLRSKFVPEKDGILSSSEQMASVPISGLRVIIVVIMYQVVIVRFL